MIPSATNNEINTQRKKKFAYLDVIMPKKKKRKKAL